MQIADRYFLALLHSNVAPSEGFQARMSPTLQSLCFSLKSVALSKTFWSLSIHVLLEDKMAST